MKKAIITGATGFIGSALVRKLLSRNIEVLALGRKAWQDVDSNRLSESKGFTYIQIDMSEIETLPFDSTVFVGHAYGAAESVEQFLRSNQTRLTRVIFTGDVFGIPSAKKWDDLASFFQTTTEIHIAPGNHDVQRSDSRDVFLQSPFGNRSYPYIIPMAHSPIVIENSTSSDWLVDQSIFDLINLSDTDLLIARHNVPVKELLAYANSRAGQSKALDSFQELKQAANSDFFVTWVIGDSGAFEQLPRLACFERDGHRFILNGVGGMSGDSVLVVKGKDFFSFKIN